MIKVLHSELQSNIGGIESFFVEFNQVNGHDEYPF